MFDDGFNRLVAGGLIGLTVGGAIHEVQVHHCCPVQGEGGVTLVGANPHGPPVQPTSAVLADAIRVMNELFAEEAKHNPHGHDEDRTPQRNPYGDRPAMMTSSMTSLPPSHSGTYPDNWMLPGTTQMKTLPSESTVSIALTSA